MANTQYVRHWEIPSKSAPGRVHTVGMTKEGRLVCTCRNWKYRHKLSGYRPCEHIRAVLQMMVEAG